MEQLKRSKYRHLLEDPDIKRWYDNICRGSKVTADLYFRRLGAICANCSTTPKEMVERSRENQQWLYDFAMDLVTKLEAEGKPRADDRTTINAILYVLKTGMPWNDLPKEYRDDVTAWRRLRGWDEQGVWKRIMDVLVAKGYSMDIVDMDSLSIDSDTIPAKKGESLSASTVTRRSRARRSTLQ